MERWEEISLSVRERDLAENFSSMEKISKGVAALLKAYRSH
jgi:hypothetical protein